MPGRPARGLSRGSPGLSEGPDTSILDLMTAPTTTAARAGWFPADDCRLDDFRAVVEQATDRHDYPYADAVEGNVLIYGERLRTSVGTVEGRRDVQAELARALLDGPGIVVFPGAVAPAVVDRATEVFTALIGEQKAAAVQGGHHLANSVANDRV